MSQSKDVVLGLDVGGTGIKGALVDINKGILLSDRKKIATPQPSTPQNICNTIQEIISDISYSESIVGCGFPSIMVDGISKTATNIDDGWIDLNAVKFFEENISNHKFNVINDADAAGLAEMKFGAGKDTNGVVLLITIGTGLGTALFIDGKLVPNTEFGQLYLKGHDKIAERYASNSARKKYKLDWENWTSRFNEYLAFMEHLLTPNLIILGGGVSKSFKTYEPLLKTKCEIKAAVLKNNAGIIGAACATRSF